MPHFSIIVPVYNVSDFITKCIDSCLNQTYRDFELILVDDGSTDDSGKICDEASRKDNRVIVVHKDNGGLVSARKAGVRVASGDYSICVDGDDWIDSSLLLKLDTIIKSYSPDVICFGFYRANGDNYFGQPFTYFAGLLSRERKEQLVFPFLIQNEKAEYFPPSLWAKAFKTDLYKKNQLKIDERIRIGEDGACTIPIVFAANEIYGLSDCLYYYRQNLSSMTKGKKVFDVFGPQFLHEQLINSVDLELFDFKSQLDRKTVHELFIVIVSQFYRNEKYRNICNFIKATLNIRLYKEIISRVSFKRSFIAKIMLFSLKHHLFSLIKFYSLIKK